MTTEKGSLANLKQEYFEMANISSVIGKHFSGLSGRSYYFECGMPTKIYGEEDIEYFKTDDRFVLSKDKKKDAEKAKVKAEEKSEPEPEGDTGEEPEWTFSKLKDLTKAEQIRMIQRLDPEIRKIPSLEKGRIELILELLEQKRKEE